MTEPMTVEQALAPCPFCGGEAQATNYIVEAAVWCLSCRATIKRTHGAKDDNGLPEAIAAWNSSTLTAQVEAQTKMLADCFRMAGADCGGNDDWRIAGRALQAVTDLRRDYDEACEELHGANGWRPRAEAAELEVEALQSENERLRALTAEMQEEQLTDHFHMRRKDGLIEAAELRAEAANALLLECKKKLALYREAHGGSYVGGTEYTQIVSEIDLRLAAREGK